jgi:hypothetical protein
MVSLWQFNQGGPGMAVQILLSLVCTLCLFLCLWSAGAFLLQRLGVHREDLLEDACAATGLGFGIAGNIVMALSFFHCATPSVLRWATCLFFLASIPLAWRSKGVLAGLAASFFRALRNAHPLVAAAFLALLGGYFLRGLLPPADFDGLMYHLASARLFLDHGGFFNVFFNPQSDFPMLTEMNFMIGLAWGNDIMCKTTSFFLGALSLAVIAVLCRRHCADSRLALGAGIVFMTFTNTIANMSNCYVDVPQALWTVLALLFMERFFRTGLRRHALVAGIFGGMAMQTKIFGVFVLLILLVQVLPLIKTRGIKKTGIDAAFVLLPALALAFPWYAKSLAYSGTILSISHATIAGQGLGHPMGVLTHSPLTYWLINSAGRILSAPWAFSLFPNLHQSDSFGPLLVAVLPFMVLLKVPHGVRRLLLYAGIFLAQVLVMEMWFVQGGSSIRYSTFVLMVCSPLIVWTISRLRNWPAIRRLLSVMVVLMVVLGMALFAKRYYREWKALALNLPRDAYYASVLPEWPVIRAMNSQKDGATVMAVYNYSNYLITVPYIAAYRPYSSAADAMADFSARNIRYIFANDKLDTLANRDPFPEIQGKQCIASANGYRLFRVPSAENGKN